MNKQVKGQHIGPGRKVRMRHEIAGMTQRDTGKHRQRCHGAEGCRPDHWGHGAQRVVTSVTSVVMFFSRGRGCEQVISLVRFV